jgi:hypothetical protein
MLTKSNYIKFLQCKKALWLYKNKPELMSEVDDGTQRMFDSGYEVEAIAYKLFPDGVDTAKDIGESIRETKKLLAEKKPVIFQATISNSNLFCRSDIIRYNQDNDTWDIIEVKSTTGVRPMHIHDLAFQKICFETAGYTVRNVSVIHMNKEYRRHGEVEPEKFLEETDITEKVNAIIEETKIKIGRALELLKEEVEPQVRILRQCSNPYECPFIDYCWKGISEDSICSIGSKLGEKKLNELLQRGIYNIVDIPKDFTSDEDISQYCDTVRSGKVCVDKDLIQKELQKIKYPIYFLDYETFGPAVPVLEGYGPYQRVIFQYSLHVQKTPTSELEHYEFLAKEMEDPTKDLAQSLQRHIGGEGSILVWFESFEKGCNEEMGERMPEFKEFFEDVNSRIYDLMTPFSKKYYVHKDFKMSASIKKVLPAVVPELSYKELDISEGMTASNSWGDMVLDNLSADKKEKIYNNLLEYCQLDTLAMVKILEKLNNL